MNNNMKSVIEDCSSLLTKYKKCKEEKLQILAVNENLNEKIKILSSQVQSDHYFILHLQSQMHDYEAELKKSSIIAEEIEKKRSTNKTPEPTKKQ